MPQPDPIDLSMMDPSTPAADDFYRHVNGGWLDANPVPSEYPGWGAFLEVHVRNEEILHTILEKAADADAPLGSPAQMVGDYFAAGMDEDGIAGAGTAPLDDILRQIEGLQALDELGGILIEMGRIGASPLHRMSISPDFEDADAYLVYLSQGGLGLPEKDYYLREDDRSKTMLAAYTDHVTAQLLNLGLGEASGARAEAIVDLEKRLAEASYSPEQLRDVELTLNRYPVDDLGPLMPEFDLTGQMRRWGIAAPTVNVNNPGFFESLDRVLGEVSMEVLSDYLRWNLIRSVAAFLPPAFEDEAFDFYGRKLGGQREQRPRWTRVLAAAGNDIGEQVARLYVEEAFSAQAKSRCEELVENLVSSMESSIRHLDWMTDTTREAALTKLAGFGYKIGYPDDWRDYTGLAIDRLSYLANRLRSAQFETERRLSRLDKPVDRDEWSMTPHSVNAYYNPIFNEIVFPAGILQPPFFYADADDAVNFGAIGAVIGHEITHGFDDMGSRFDERGRKRDWWTETDREEFDARSAALAQQFSAYEVVDDLTVNGQLTLGENIADLGGVKIAFGALLSTLHGDEPDIDELSPQQRFFLSYATMWRMNYTDEYMRLLVNVDSHSPHRFRVNGPLSNLPAFAETFDVGEGSPMRRPSEEIVRIW